MMTIFQRNFFFYLFLLSFKVHLLNFFFLSFGLFLPSFFSTFYSISYRYSLVQILRHGCRRRRRCGMIVRSTTTTFIIIIIEQQCIVVGHRSRSSNRTTDMTMSTHPPIPFLTSATAITDALTLYTTFHFHRRVPGRR